MTLLEIQTIVRSLHAQEPLSDSLPPGTRFVWEFHDEIATLQTIENQQVTEKPEMAKT